MTKIHNEIECIQEKRLCNMEEKQNESYSMVRELRDALLPSEFHLDDGLIKRVENLQADITEMQNTIMKAKIWLLASGTIFGVLFAVAQIVIALIEK